jgi:hypothetical protein
MKSFLIVVLVALINSGLAVADSTSKAAAHPSAAPSNSIAITPAEWQELRGARQAAVKANPDLLKKAAAVSQRMRAFEGKLDAAMVKADPKVAVLVAQLEEGTRGQRTAVAATKVR